MTHKYGLILGVAVSAWGANAFAQQAPANIGDLIQRQSELDAQVKALSAQQQSLSQQIQQLAADHPAAPAATLAAAPLDAPIANPEPEALAAGDLDALRGAGAPQGGIIQAAQVTPATGDPQTVGAPPPPAPPRDTPVAALPEGSGVLTRQGHWSVESSLDFTHGSSNRLVFRGVEIITGIQIGVIEANDADRNALSGAVSVKYGLMDRIELEMRFPYVTRFDRVTTLVQRDTAASRSLDVNGAGLGDIEMTARYQLNNGSRGRPIFVANLRAKTDTGTSPYEIKRDEFGVALDLATGSGFTALEPALTFLYATDPAVIFGGISYLSHLPKDIDRTIGEAQIGRVDPGDSIGGSAGFGFALNPRFSFSLGYKYNYIFPTKSIVSGTLQESESLQVGAFTFGWSMRLTPKLNFNNTFEVGTTSDSPDMRIAVRFPVSF